MTHPESIVDGLVMRGACAGTGDGYTLETAAVRLAETIAELRTDGGIPAHVTNTLFELAIYRTNSSLVGSDTGVFVGASAPDYGGLQTAASLTIDPYTNSGTAMSNTANRLSYHLDPRGPSLKVDTACASSLNAVHLACQHLRGGNGRSVRAA